MQAAPPIKAVPPIKAIPPFKTAVPPIKLSHANSG